MFNDCKMVKWMLIQLKASPAFINGPHLQPRPGPPHTEPSDARKMVAYTLDAREIGPFALFACVCAVQNAGA